MANENATGESQGDGTQTGAESKKAEDQGNTQNADQKTDKPAEETKKDEKTFTQDDLNRYLAKEKKTWEKKVADAEAAAKLSEEERRNAEIETLKSQIKERDARDAVTAEAVKVGFKNPNAIFKLVSSDLEYDDKGNISNLSDVLDQAKTDYPELFGEAKPNDSINAGSGKGGDDETAWTKEKVAALSPKEINENWESIQEWMKTQKK